MQYYKRLVQIFAASVLTITFLSGCQKKYDTKEQCELEEMKKSKISNDAAYRTVAAYCDSLFDKSSVSSSYQGDMKEPNWVKANKGENAVYVDTNSITRPEGGLVDLWIKVVMNQKNPKDFQLSLTRIDCLGRKTKYLSSAIYVNDAVSEKSGESDWTDIVPGRAGSQVLNMVCN